MEERPQEEKYLKRSACTTTLSVSSFCVCVRKVLLFSSTLLEALSLQPLPRLVNKCGPTCGKGET